MRLGVISTFVGAIPGLGGASAGAAGFFGLVNALCQWDMAVFELSVLLSCYCSF